MTEMLLERLRALSDDDRRSLLAFMAGRNPKALRNAMNAWERQGLESADWGNPL